MLVRPDPSLVARDLEPADLLAKRPGHLCHLIHRVVAGAQHRLRVHRRLAELRHRRVDAVRAGRLFLHDLADFLEARSEAIDRLEDRLEMTADGLRRLRSDSDDF